jgi:hypothetical protein
MTETSLGERPPILEQLPPNFHLAETTKLQTYLTKIAPIIRNHNTITLFFKSDGGTPGRLDIPQGSLINLEHWLFASTLPSFSGEHAFDLFYQDC